MGVIHRAITVSATPCRKNVDGLDGSARLSFVLRISTTVSIAPGPSARKPDLVDDLPRDPGIPDRIKRDGQERDEAVAGRHVRRGGA